MYMRGYVRDIIKGIMREDYCENNVHAVVYGMRVNLDPIRNVYNIV